MRKCQHKYRLDTDLLQEEANGYFQTIYRLKRIFHLLNQGK